MEKRQPEIEVMVAGTNALVRECLRIRYKVYVEELGWEPPNDERLEQDDFDEGALHILATVDGKPAGTCRMVFLHFAGFPLERLCGISLPDDDKEFSVEIGRDCVLKEYRRMGVMSAMMSWLADRIAARTTISRIYMLNDAVNEALLRANDVQWVDCGICVEHHGTRRVAYIDVDAELQRKGLL